MGDGKTINVWKDPWIPNEANDFKLLSPEEGVGSNLKACDLMTNDGKTWDIDKLRAVVTEEEAAQINAITIFPNKVDKLMWQFEKNGIYSVRSGYRLAADLEAHNQESNGINWKKLWKLDIPPKVKIFLWRVLRNVLPTKERLRQRGLNLEEDCGCGEEVENITHALLKCERAAEVWDLWHGRSLITQDDFVTSFNKIGSMTGETLCKEFGMIAWSIWGARNTRLWKQTSVPADVVFYSAFEALQAWVKANEIRGVSVMITPNEEGTSQTNIAWSGEVDASIFSHPIGRGMGCVISHPEGQFLRAQSGHAYGAYTASTAEALAIRESLLFVEAHIQGHGVLFSDAQGLVNALYKDEEDWSEVGEIILECKAILNRLGNVKVVWVKRENVSKAHSLAKHARHFDSCKIWTQIPDCIVPRSS